MKKVLFFSLLLYLYSCGNSKNTELILPEGKEVGMRFISPENFSRTEISDTISFEYYLRNLPLKPEGTLVKHFDGSEKTKENVYLAVVDLPIGTKDLHQCADAVMRLRAEHLFQQKKFDEIHFNFTNGFRADYSKWRAGFRISVEGNNVSWVKKDLESTSYESFWNYLETIFSYAGTLSLSQELKAIDVKEMKIGDVFIKGGSPGHAVIVVDMAINPKTNKKIFMLAQSYMPAQEIQILLNPNNVDLSPWYELDFGTELITPEWKFKSSELKRF